MTSDNTDDSSTETVVTFESIYNDLVDEGIWLEEQVQNQAKSYKKCPLCQQLGKNFASIADFVGSRLQSADEAVEKHGDDVELPEIKSLLAKTLLRDKAWLDMFKEAMLSMFQAGHTRSVVKAHPDIKSPATSPGHTKTRIPKNRRKALRKVGRQARKRGRG